MYEIIEINHSRGSMEIVNTCIDGMITDSEESRVTLLTFNGGVVSFIVNRDDFEMIKNKWSNVLENRIKDMEQAREQHESGRKAQLMMQAKMTDAVVNHNR